MLIETNYKSGDIVSLKLINSDELIARFQSENDSEVELERPLSVAITPQGLGMMPWMFLGAKETVTLKKNHIFTIMPAKKDAANQYLQGTTSIALR